MKIGVFSDIHSNTEGLGAVLEGLRDAGADAFVCLGDLVGYGPEPNEVVETIRGLNCPCIMGNHDRAAFDAAERQVFNPYARSAIEWTASRLSPENMDYLKGLPMSHSEDGALYIHASPHEPEAWNYVDRPEQYKLAFGSLNGHRLCFIGHTHRPSIVVQDPKGHYYPHSSRSVDLIPGFRYIVNDGSTGQSRDGLTLAGCALYDTEAQTVELMRVPYDVEATRRKIRDAGLPTFLEERLAHGI